ncbi:MAG: HEAT repeat domain-containing protein [Polyangia bacterium]|nr:HEAT repeat domain-containing protein [Polyangia bacterium]
MSTSVHGQNRPLAPVRRTSGALCPWLASLLALTLASLSLPGSARADKEIVKRLLHNKEYKVRLQAAIYLAKLQDPTMLHALIKCVDKDDHYLVRSFCAGALGRLGKEEALPVLRKALKDSHEFVRRRAQTAIDAIEALTGGGTGYPVKHKPKAEMFVLVDTSRGRGGGIPSRVKEHTDRSLRQKLNQEPSFEVARSGVAIPAPWLQQRRIPAYRVDVSVEQVRRRREHSRAFVFAKLKVIVTRHPARAVVVITTTESQSSQEVGAKARPRDVENLFQFLERQAVEGAVERVVQRIRQFKAT